MSDNRKLGNLINAISIRMRLLRLIQWNGNAKSSIMSERELLMLELLSEQDAVPLSKLTGLWKDLSGSTLSAEISRLVEKGWATKGILASNQRARTVSLTELGKKTLADNKAQSEIRYGVLMQAIDPSAPDRKVLERILTKAVQSIDERISAFAKEPEQPITCKSH